MSTLNTIQVSSAQSAEKDTVDYWNSNAVMTIQAYAFTIMDFAMCVEKFSQNST